MLSNIILFIAIVNLRVCLANYVPHESPNLRIIGGKEVTPHSAPFMVYYEVKDPKRPHNAFSCDGTLITPSHVLTAAHCLEGGLAINYLLVGAHNISSKEPTQQRVRASKYLLHSNFDKPLSANDIAIIKLKSPVTLNKNVAVIKLPGDKDANKTYAGQLAAVYGWGYIHDEPKVKTDVLRSVDVRVLANADCLKLAPEKDVYRGDICTDGNGPRGTCHGDSGGPLVFNGVQIGVVSRSASRYCERKYPSIYTRATSYTTWITATLKKL